MHRNFIALFGNIGLVAVVLVLLSGPLLLGQLLGSSQSGALGLQTAGVSRKAMSVIPDESTFAEHAQFDSHPVAEPTFFQTSVTFTAFGGNRAVYTGLLSVYNTGDVPLSVRLEGGELSGDAVPVDVWITLTDEATDGMTLLTQEVRPGSDRLVAADVSGFTDGHVVVGDTVVEARKESSTSLALSTVLEQGWPVGERLYLGPAFYRRGEVVTAQSQLLVLQPQAKAVVSLVVATEDEEIGQRQIVLPLVIRAE